METHPKAAIAIFGRPCSEYQTGGELHFHDNFRECTPDNVHQIMIVGSTFGDKAKPNWQLVGFCKALATTKNTYLCFDAVQFP